MPLSLATAVAVAIVLAALAGIRSRFLRGRLAFAFVLLLGAAVSEVALNRGIGDAALLASLARLLLTAGITIGAVSLLLNPWQQNRPSERVPAIVQDVIVIVLFAVLTTMLFDEKLLTTSAVGAVVVGFALQDTLGNLFSGLAIQVEKPFKVGQWIRVADHEGQVQEVTWRATKLLTKAGQFAIVPNSVMSKEAILNFSEPTIPTRLEVMVGATYEAPPNQVRRALMEAVENAPLALKVPAPDIILEDFSSSSITYRVRFWIEDYARDNTARDQVRTNVWYAFKREGIEIPFPIQVEYSREEKPARPVERIDATSAQLGKLDLFAELDEAARTEFAAACREHLFADGERIVKQGDPGRSMFVVLDGRVRVVLEPSNQEVAVTAAGGVFGEMSMLTGDPRTASVRAFGDALLLEIGADQFRALALRCPGLIERVSAIVSSRRVGLAEAQAAADIVQTKHTAQSSMMARIRAFLKV